MDPTAPDRPSRAAVPLLVAVLTFAAFLPTLRGEFLNWDDNFNFTDNPSYRGLSPGHLKWMATTTLMGHYHPLTWLTLGIDYTIWGMNPVGYRLTSLLFHCANAALLTLVLAALLRLDGRPAPRWACAAGALFYAVHPLRVESVAWITERRDVLCGFFTLLCILAYLRHIDEDRRGRPARRWLALSALAFAAALMSKALAITLPGVLFLLDVYFGRWTPATRKRVLLEKLPFLLISCADAAVMLFAMRHVDQVHSIASYNVPQRAAQAAYGLCFYLAKTAWPAGLIPLYQIDPALDPAAPLYLGAMAAVAGLSALLLVRRRREPAVLAAWIAYVVLVFPVLGVAVTGMQIAADRYTYLSLLPASVLVAGWLARPARWKPALVLLLLPLAALTFRQTGFWTTSVTLWSRQIEFDQRCFVAYFDRGLAKKELGDVDGALADCDAAMALQQPAWAEPWYIRATLRGTKGNHRGAVEDFSNAIQLNPKKPHYWTGRAISRTRLGDHENAVADYTRALELEPGSTETLRDRGLALVRAGRPGEAILDFTRALELRPDDVDACVRRGTTRAIVGDLPGAAADFRKALEAAPPGWPQRPQVEEMLRRARSE